MCGAIGRASSISRYARSSIAVAELTTRADALLGLGGRLKGDAGDSGTRAISSVGGVAVGLDRVDVGILVLHLTTFAAISAHGVLGANMRSGSERPPT